MNIHKHKSQSSNNTNNTNNNNQLTPELNHHFLSSRRSGPKGLVLPAKNKRWNSSSHTETNSQTNPQTNPAFTIIEVVLVLAIAGLIFLMVFIALPALQRNQRDTRRKNDLSTFASALQNYASNNRGEYPKSVVWIGRDRKPIMDFAKDYLNWPGGNIDPTNTNKEFIDPSTGKGYIIDIEAPYEAAYNIFKASNYMVYAYGFRCQQPGETGYKAKNGSISVWQSLESGGVNCIDVR